MRPLKLIWPSLLVLLVFVLFDQTTVFGAQDNSGQISKNKKSKRLKQRFSKKKRSSKKDPRIEWYQPEVEISPKKHRTRVLLSGLAKYGSKIRINKKRFVINQKGRLRYISRKSALVNASVVKVNRSGLFELVVDLPFSVVALPIEIVSAKGKHKYYTLRIRVEKYKVRFVKKLTKRSPYYYRRYELWLGTGYNYLKYVRSGTDTGQELDYVSFKGPSLYAEAKVRASDQIDIYATIKSSPGKVSSSDEIQISEGIYKWETTSLAVRHSPVKWNVPIFGSYRSYFSYQGGIQYHSIPFLQRRDVNTSNVALINSNISMISFGGGIEISRSYSWQFESFFRLQHPISSDVEISKPLSFDGSLGIVYRNLGRWKLGLFWYGQFQSYDFKFKIDQVEVTGDQSLLFSNIEIRAGYEFN